MTPVLAWQVVAGVALDLAFGDPRWFPHPVRGFGWFLKHWESLWRATRLPLRLAGAIFGASAIAFAGGLVWLTLPWLAIFWIWALLALRDLDVEALAVLKRLESGDLPGARTMLARIVGRDTVHLDEPEILRAVVETVAENLSDAVIAPLFYLALGGPAFMAMYKAANTLDSTVGYKNARYREFGWFSARFDDIANYLPARLTVGLVWICALLSGYDAARSWRVTWRDAARQPSPNSGYPEAVVAGALGIRLGGQNFYGGVPAMKDYLGDPVRPLAPARVHEARRLLYGSAFLMVLLVCGVAK